MGHIGGSTILIVLAIAGFIYFIFKIHDKKNEQNSFRNSLFMALIGIIILILGASINTTLHEEASQGKALILIIGAIYTLYGGYYALNKYSNTNTKD
ncbi:MAG: hypothetical protein WCI92_17555 [Bacteroidota bacterium]